MTLRDARAVGNVGVVVFIVVLVSVAVLVVLRNRSSLVAKRGLSVGADLAGLRDAPRVRVRAMTTAGPDRVRLILMSETPEPEGAAPGSSDLDLLIHLEEKDFGFGLLRAWLRSESSLAIVLPPGGRLVRLRSVEDLQHLTLRRADAG
jgi:hypothetical protein